MPAQGVENDFSPTAGNFFPRLEWRIIRCGI